MTKKQLSILAILLIVAIGATNQAFATSITNFKMADDTYAKVGFIFKEGIEETYFPIFKTTSDMIDNTSTSFQLQGTVGDYPYLHEALDKAYKYRLAEPTANYDFKQFTVDVELVKSGNIQKKFHYNDCTVSGASVDTLFDNAEGYTTTKTGFAIIDTIDFACGGVDMQTEISSQYDTREFPKYAQKMAGDVHSWVTFAFDDGIEKIDFPVFKMNGGFDEKSTQRPSFTVQGIPQSYPLLDTAIVKARESSGLPFGVLNNDFNARVDFANDSKTFRSLEYADCRIDEYNIDTNTDAEEGYTGKSGFAIVENITASCTGLNTQNYQPVESSHDLVQTNPYMMGGRTHAIATIILSSGEKESVDFPVFKQTSTVSYQTTKSSSATSNVYSRLNPAFQLQGVPGDTPILYSVTDLIRSRGQMTGTDFQGLFSVDVDLIHGETKVRTYHYTNCRVASYDTDTAFNKEEGYVGANGFALVSVYSFECSGYQPDNPAYDALFVVEKAKTQSSKDLRDTSQWAPSFRYNGKY